MKEELLDEWLCDYCKRDTPHKLNVILQRLPEIVLIRVKISNNFNNVKFKEKLKINSTSFELIGVVHHQGVSYGLLFYFVFIFIQI
jgi:ubiquitin C-terminal hydrolase